MKAINIFTEPFELGNIQVCRIDKVVNDHFQAAVSGYVCMETDEFYSKYVPGTGFVIKASTEENEDITLFRGIIQDIRIYKEKGVVRVTVCAKSKTTLLDMGNHIRTYQGKDHTYRDIIDQVLSYHKDTAVIQPKGKGSRIGGLVVQYEETDWQLLKRLASQLNTVLVPDCTNDHICFYFGNPRKKEVCRLESEERRMRRYLDRNGKELTEYSVNSRHIYNLCECMTVNHSPYYIYKIRGYMDKQELWFEYTLRSLTGFEVPEVYNESLSGISIMGTVKEVSGIRVRIDISCEADISFGNAIWFLFSTVYSSPDGTGWYCMPEQGDRIRLYIPGKQEKEAYVISAVHLDNEQGLREDPDEKCIRSIHQKEIRLTPGKIVLTNNKGISITLDDKEGITIKSNQKINIISENEVEIKGAQIQLEGQSGVLLMEGSNMLMVRDGIKEQGMHIEHR